MRLPVPGWRRMGSAREETVQGPSSSSRKDLPKRSDPSEVGWGRRGFGDLEQVVRAGLDTLITGEADYPTEVKARELGINLILGGHRETEAYGVKCLMSRSRLIARRNEKFAAGGTKNSKINREIHKPFFVHK